MVAPALHNGGYAVAIGQPQLITHILVKEEKPLFQTAHRDGCSAVQVDNGVRLWVRRVDCIVDNVGGDCNDGRW